ncbi:hypothetical protein U1Q18_001377 [Sarracenia purpurea var. burkii]
MGENSISRTTINTTHPEEQSSPARPREENTHDQGKHRTPKKRKRAQQTSLKPDESSRQNVQDTTRTLAETTKQTDGSAAGKGLGQAQQQTPGRHRGRWGEAGKGRGGRTRLVVPAFERNCFGSCAILKFLFLSCCDMYLLVECGSEIDGIMMTVLHATSMEWEENDDGVVAHG